MPGRGRLLLPFTRRFRLGFALLRGGSRINQHRAGVLSLDGSTAFRPHAPYHTGLGASEHSRDSPFSLLPFLGPPAPPVCVCVCARARNTSTRKTQRSRARCLSPYLVPPGNPSLSQVFKPRNRPPGWIVFGDARQQSLVATSWEMGVLGRRFPGWQSGSGLSQLEGSAGKN